MAKYGNFENQPLSQKPLPIQRKYAQFRRPGLERECVCNFWNFWPIAKLVRKQSVKAHGPLVLFLIIYVDYSYSQLNK